MATVSGRARPDVGRLLMVPPVGAILTFDVLALARGSAPGTVGVLWWLGNVLTSAFYALVIWCYLRRGPAIATSRSVTAHVAAVTATLIVFIFPLLRGAPAGAGQQGVADALLVIGQAWALWALRFLGRNLSVIAQAREVVQGGPYRWVRHPLYAGEIVAAVGLALSANSGPAVLVCLAICGLQAYRALREEQILLEALPGYREYRARTAALLPGLF